MAGDAEGFPPSASARPCVKNLRPAGVLKSEVHDLSR
jgi:hypothetical protein